MFKSTKSTDYDQARARMVADQLVARGISDERVLEAMRKIPRHLFVPESRRSQAYHDRPLSIGYGQTISQPYIVAFMTASLELTGEEKVLEIGTGSGYQTAILCQLARHVISIECIDELADSARKTLANLGYDTVEVILGDGSAGLPEEAPFDAIMFTAAAPEVPWPLRQQLAAGGQLVGPVGSRYDQTLVRLRRRGADWKRDVLGPVIFVPLIGKHGWQE
ncbi:MAG: protein-L-isoaspartate(D-aspartate) O-methyltransferase [Anaerolineae bacterium]|nr:protein-L-isoaspartate(D-aspartate) O-methyltransferase [Anaerolineae bacterium]